MTYLEFYELISCIYCFGWLSIKVRIKMMMAFENEHSIITNIIEGFTIGNLCETIFWYFLALVLIILYESFHMFIN